MTSQCTLRRGIESPLRMQPDELSFELIGCFLETVKLIKLHAIKIYRPPSFFFANTPPSLFLSISSLSSLSSLLSLPFSLDSALCLITLTRFAFLLLLHLLCLFFFQLIHHHIHHRYQKRHLLPPFSSIAPRSSKSIPAPVQLLQMMVLASTRSKQLVTFSSSTAENFA